MKYYKTTIQFDPKANAEGSNQNAMEAVLQRLESRSVDLTFPLKQHFVEITQSFLRKRETHTVQIIIASPDDDIVQRLPGRLPVCNRQTSTVEQLTDKLYTSLIPLKPDGTLLMKLKTPNNAEAAFFYLKNKLREYITEDNATYTVVQYSPVLLVGLPESQQVIVNEKRKTVTIRHKIGTMQYCQMDETFSIIMTSPLDVLFSVRAKFLKHPTHSGQFDAIDTDKFQIFVLQAFPTDQYVEQRNQERLKSELIT